MKKVPARIPVSDPHVDRALEDVRIAVTELARDPLANARTLEVVLPNASLVRVRHGLDRKPVNFVLGPPQGPISAGYIEKLTPDDATAEIWLKATGFGATVSVTLTVW